MTNENASRANGERMYRYRFGTFEERLMHYCASLEIDEPELAFEHKDDLPLLTDDFYQWLLEHHICFHWLFVGDPRSLLIDWTEGQKRRGKLIEVTSQLEPEVQKALTALIKAVVDSDLPMEGALEVFSDAVKDWRARKAA